MRLGSSWFSENWLIHITIDYKIGINWETREFRIPIVRLENSANMITNKSKQNETDDKEDEWRSKNNCTKQRQSRGHGIQIDVMATTKFI